MKDKIIFKFDFENGWGDTFLSIFDTLNCVDYLKKTYPNIEYYFIVNDNFGVNTLDKVVNVESLNSYFERFEIRFKGNFFRPTNGLVNFEGQEYKRIYSGRNPDVLNNTNGIFDVFVPTVKYEEFQSFNIPFLDFTFNDVDDRPKDFDVFSPTIIESVESFIRDNFENGYESIFYRCLPQLNEERVLRFRERLVSTLDPNKKYFICSNSHFVKEKFSETSLNLVMYRDLEKHNPNYIADGFTRFGQTVEEALFVVGEMILLSRGNHIYYGGDMSYRSLFNWYSINVKKVKITDINL